MEIFLQGECLNLCGCFSMFYRRDFERNSAALKLQAFHRQRQEKKEMENQNVYKPKFKQRYRGHRNARTMVCIEKYILVCLKLQLFIIIIFINVLSSFKKVNIMHRRAVLYRCKFNLNFYFNSLLAHLFDLDICLHSVCMKLL